MSRAGDPPAGNASVRPPAVAGMFYPGDPATCQKTAAALVDQARRGLFRFESEKNSRALPADEATECFDSNLLFLRSPGIGAVVPHAGWICSGAVAADALAAMARHRNAVDLVVVFGAIHTPLAIDRAALDSHGRWSVPGNDAEITAALRDELSRATNLFVTDDRFHQHEHAVEVELPLIQALWPDAKILPVEVPVEQQAIEIGRAVAAAVASARVSAVYLASSDLTHYGPNYRFTPAGIGQPALRWAMENDRRILRIMTDMTPEKIVPEVRSRLNACGGGAIAAMMSACLHSGARKAIVLRHTNSYQTLAKVAPQSADNSVGYAAVWVG